MIKFFLFCIILTTFSFENSHDSFEPDSLKSILPKVHGEKKVEILNQISLETANTSTVETSSYALIALNLSVATNNKIEQLKALTNLSYALALQNKLDSAILINNKALKLSNQLKKNNYKIKILNNMGLINWKKGNYKEAEVNYQQALKNNKPTDQLEEAKSLNYLGLIYWKLSEYPKSLDYFLKALRIKKQIGDKYEIALTLNNIATVFNLMYNFNSSIIYSRKALKISKDIENEYIKSRSFDNLGVSYSKMKEYTKAIDYLNNAILVRKQNNIKSGLAYSLMHRGDIYFELGKYDLSLLDYFGAEGIFKQLNNKHGIASLFLSLGNVYENQNSFENAISSYKNALTYSSSENLKSLMREAHFKLSKIYKLNNNFEGALEEYTKYISINESIDNIEVKENFGKLQLEYEAETKQKENELLKIKNEAQNFELEKNNMYKMVFIGFSIFGLVAFFSIYSRYNLSKKTQIMLREKNKKIQIQSKKLGKLVNTKDKLFSIIAHDLKNPFQSLQGYSDLLKTDFDKLSDEEKFDYINNISKITKQSSSLLDNLLQWSKIQRGDIKYHPKKLNLKEIVKETIELSNLTAKAKEINIECEIQKNVIAYSEQNIIKTVLRNLLSNAIKFSPEKSIIKIFTEERKYDIKLSVKDNGVGIKKELINNIFNFENTTLGTAKEKGTGLGLVLCKELVESYNGKLTVESEVNKGSTFSFTIPNFLSS